MELKFRCCDMINELGLPTTRFCKNINLSTRCYYDWQNGKLKLSEERLKKIDQYLKKYNF